jgi:hypothetical protein
MGQILAFRPNIPRATQNGLAGCVLPTPALDNQMLPNHYVSNIKKFPMTNRWLVKGQKEWYTLNNLLMKKLLQYVSYENVVLIPTEFKAEHIFCSGYLFTDFLSLAAIL